MPKRRKRQSGRGRPGFLSKLTIDQIQAEITRRLDSLLLRRSEIESELESINADLAQPGDSRGENKHRAFGRQRAIVTYTAKRRGRGGNEQSLHNVLQSLLRGKTMSVPEMAEAAKKAGHKSKSKNFRTIVSLALLNHPKKFRRVSRGLYTAR